MALEKIIIEGGNPLSGKVAISGSKNSGLPILSISLLTSDKCEVRRVPSLEDIWTMKSILDFLGCKTSFEGNHFNGFSGSNYFPRGSL